MRRRRFRLSMSGLGGVVLVVMGLVCVLSLPWTTGLVGERGFDYNHQILAAQHVPPGLSAIDGETLANLPEGAARPGVVHRLFGTDGLGRSLLSRCLLGGSISLGIGLAAATLTMIIGTAWGMISGYAGGRVDSAMMRTVDVLYGLPYILLVVLLKVAVDGALERYQFQATENLKGDAYVEARAENDAAKGEMAAALQQLAAARESGDEARVAGVLAEVDAANDRVIETDIRPWLLRLIETQGWLVNVGSLLVAIGAVSWLTLARVVRGQVLSLKAQPFVEAARAQGAGPGRILVKHILPNLIGPIIVYTTLTVPQAILQESFLSFLGIGVQAPLPSWGNLASEGLAELNPVVTRYWLIFWPCVLLGVTLLSLNFLGDGLRDRFDPRSRTVKA